jgi:hypothetical protein
MANKALRKFTVEEVAQVRTQCPNVLKSEKFNVRVQHNKEGDLVNPYIAPNFLSTH